MFRGTDFEANNVTAEWVFDAGEAGIIHNTWDYDREADTWRWVIDIERGEKVSNFAKVTLERR